MRGAGWLQVSTVDSHGFDIWRFKNFEIDVQCKVHQGTSRYINAARFACSLWERVSRMTPPSN